MVNINTIRTASELFKPQTVLVKSKQLFSFATKHQLKSPNGELLEDGMILTHLTDFIPKHGYIDTARSGAGMVRDSVHFAVNHGVTGHLGGNWNFKKYAILMPMNAAKQTAGNKFVGGIAGDFYSKGKIKIPKGSILVRKSLSVPEGQYRISDASKIDEFKELHGVKLIETSEFDIKSTVDNIIHRLGYKVKSGDFNTWGGSLSDFNSFNSYLRKNGLKPMMHTYTPNGKTEQLIMNLKCRANNTAGWAVKDKAGNIIIDYQKEYLQSLKYIEKFTKKTGFPNDFDTNQLAQIIRTSKTPQDALSLIESKLKIKSLEPIKKKGISELELLTHYRGCVGGNDIEKYTDNVILNYLKKANKKTLEQLYNCPSTAECQPDALLQKDGTRDVVINLFKKQHLIFDNTIANKLYELG